MRDDKKPWIDSSKMDKHIEDNPFDLPFKFDKASDPDSRDKVTEAEVARANSATTKRLL